MTTRVPVRDFVLRLDEPREDFARHARAVGEATAQLERDLENADPRFLERYRRRQRGDRGFGTGAVLPRREGP